MEDFNKPLQAYRKIQIKYR